MKWQKGKSGNASGRPKGARNKVGVELRQKIADFLEGNFDDVAEDFGALDAKERCRFFVSLLPYCIGKKQDVTLEGQVDRLSDDELNELLETLKKQARPAWIEDKN